MGNTIHDQPARMHSSKRGKKRSNAQPRLWEEKKSVVIEYKKNTSRNRSKKAKKESNPIENSIKNHRNRSQSIKNHRNRSTKPFETDGKKIGVEIGKSIEFQNKTKKKRIKPPNSLNKPSNSLK
jgi:hypothetical protein